MKKIRVNHVNGKITSVNAEALPGEETILAPIYTCGSVIAHPEEYYVRGGAVHMFEPAQLVKIRSDAALSTAKSAKRERVNEKFAEFMQRKLFESLPGYAAYARRLEKMLDAITRAGSINAVEEIEEAFDSQEETSSKRCSEQAGGRTDGSV